MQGKLKIRRGKGIACADVGRNAKKCAWSMSLRACVKVCLRRCQEKYGEVRMEDAIQSVCRWLPAHMSGKRI